jgi:hypothetical protein
MESRNVTRILGDVRYLADIEGQTDRHPDADLLRRVNASIRALRGMVTARGAPYFLTATTAATLASTQVSGEGYSEVPYPTTAVQIHGVDVEPSSGSGAWYPLQPISWGQRRNARIPGPGYPEFFAVRTIPAGSGSSTVAGTIALFPAAGSGQYKIWYLPDFTDLVITGGTDVFLGLPDWHEWVMWNVVEDIAARDDDQRETFAIAREKKAAAETRLVEAIGRVQSAGPMVPRRRTRRW